MIKAIIFDFFGVIGQSTYKLIHEYFDTNEEQNKQFKELSKSLDYGFISQKQFIKSYGDILHISEAEMQKIYHDTGHRFGMSKKLLEFIKELEKNYKIGLISNVSKESYFEFIEPLKEYFDVIVTSYHTKLAKPERAIYELAAKDLAVNVSECVMIDDHFDNCEGARAAGMEAIQFEDTEHLKIELKRFLTNPDN